MRDARADERLVADLLRARDGAFIIPSPSQRGIGFEIDSGYHVGHLLHDRLLKRGYQSIGRKIGFTNRAVWEQLKVSEPVWAHMYAQTVHFAQGGYLRLPLDGMVAPRLESVVVLKLRHAVPSDDPSVEELARGLEWVAVGFEIVDSHYPDWRFTASEAVADFGVHAALVVGTPWHVESEDPQHIATSLRTLKVTLRGGKDFVAEGEGHNALGSPLLALGFLPRVLAAQSWAPPLMAGEVIATGTLTALPYLRHGESYRVDVVGAPLARLQLDLKAPSA
ncbi:MAG: 2-keto-4-pentenoate hydratase [Isosphaeraceae bacterium]